MNKEMDFLVVEKKMDSEILILVRQYLANLSKGELVQIALRLLHNKKEKDFIINSAKEFDKKCLLKEVNQNDK